MTTSPPNEKSSLCTQRRIYIETDKHSDSEYRFVLRLILNHGYGVHLIDNTCKIPTGVLLVYLRGRELSITRTCKVEDRWTNAVVYIHPDPVFPGPICWQDATDPLSIQLPLEELFTQANNLGVGEGIPSATVWTQITKD